MNNKTILFIFAVFDLFVIGVVVFLYVNLMTRFQTERDAFMKERDILEEELKEAQVVTRTLQTELNEEQQEMVIKQESEKIPAVYYYTQEYDPPLFAFEKFSLDLEVVDHGKVLVQGDGFAPDVFGKYKENQFFVSNKNVLSILNLENNTIEEFITEETNNRFGSAVISKSGKMVAYTIEPNEDGNVLASLFVYNLTTKVRTKLLDKKMGLYTGLTALGWSDDERYIVVRELGGDGGGFNGALYIVDVLKPNELKRVLIPLHGILGTLGPDGKRWLYTFCPTSEDETLGFIRECRGGEEIRVRDLISGSEEIVYTNKTHEDNVSKDMLQVVFGAIWQNDERIIFSIPDGIFLIDLVKKSSRLLYPFRWVDPESIAKTPIYLLYADERYVVFERRMLYEGVFILNLESGRVIELTGVDFVIKPSNQFRGILYVR